MILFFIHIRYKKQRKYVSQDDIIVKFLPVPLAVILANIVLRVKPVEAEFALTECGHSVSETKGYLYTLNGTPVQPEKFAGILSDTLAECGFPIGIADLRHALEAFSHKIVKDDTAPSHVYSAMANHNSHTSSGYGRDQNCFIGIPADLCEANRSACLKWNTLILDSPSSLLRSTSVKIFQQLLELELMQAPKEAPGHDSMECGPNAVLLNITSALMHGTRQENPQASTGESNDKSQVCDQSHVLASPDTVSRSALEGTSRLVTRHQFLDTVPKFLFSDTTSTEDACKTKCDKSQDDVTLRFQGSLNILKSSAFSANSSAAGQASDPEVRSISHQESLATNEYVAESIAVESDRSQIQQFLSSVNYSALPTDAVAKVGKNPRDQVKLDHSEHAVKKRMVESEQLSEDQKQALCCLQENNQSAFIIMPTGSGKTSLIWLFKRESECSIIFAPFQLLVKQVCNVLEKKNNTWFWPFDGSRGSVDCMLATAQFIVLPYEAATESVHLVSELHRRNRMGPIWVDEV